MKLENEFVVPAPVERAWSVLLDVERVAPCLPGAAIEGTDGDEHAGTMTVKIGPITARYKGTVRIEEADEAARRAVMRAQAKDVRGQGTASATITSTMEPVPEGTRVRVETDMRVTGPAAQFGRGVMQDVSAKIMDRFADCLAGEIGRGEPAPAAAAPAPEPDGRPAPAPAGAEATPAGTIPAEPAAASSSAAEPTPAGRIPPAPRPSAEVLDLGEAGRAAVLKRAVPVAAGVLALVVLLRILRRR